MPACAEGAAGRGLCVCVCENTFFCQAGSVRVRSQGVYDKLYLLFFTEKVE